MPIVFTGKVRPTRADQSTEDSLQEVFPLLDAADVPAIPSLTTIMSTSYNLLHNKQKILLVTWNSQSFRHQIRFQGFCQ